MKRKSLTDVVLTKRFQGPRIGCAWNVRITGQDFSALPTLEPYFTNSVVEAVKGYILGHLREPLLVPVTIECHGWTMQSTMLQTSNQVTLRMSANIEHLEPLVSSDPTQVRRSILALPIRIDLQEFTAIVSHTRALTCCAWSSSSVGIWQELPPRTSVTHKTKQTLRLGWETLGAGRMKSGIRDQTAPTS